MSKTTDQQVLQALRDNTKLPDNILINFDLNPPYRMMTSKEIADRKQAYDDEVKAAAEAEAQYAQARLKEAADSVLIPSTAPIQEHEPVTPDKP